MKLWRRALPPLSVEAPSPRTDIPMQGPTEGELARRRAEQALGAEMQKTAEIRSRTSVYESMGARFGALRERNHIREDIYQAMIGSTKW